MKHGCLCGTVLAVSAAAVAAAKPKPRSIPVNDETVTRAIAGAVEYLYSIANKEGHWDAMKTPDLKPRGGGYPPDRKWGGETALALYALATAGQQSDPRFRKALTWLMDQEMIDTYAVSLRLQLIHQLLDPEKHREVLNRDANYILRGARPFTPPGVKADPKAPPGARDPRTLAVRWDYMPPPELKRKRECDFSCANYAVLALWAAGDERFEVSAKLWTALERTYVLGQNPDGGWAYYPSDPKKPRKGNHHVSTGSMTTAGIASLYLIIDRTYARMGGLGSFRKSPSYQAIQRGLAWMGKHFSPSRNTGRPGWFETYYFYNCERVGAAAGLKYFGTHDWFREIAAVLLRAQRDNGAIPFTTGGQHGGTLVDTAFALLFLTKGSAPVIVNKLQHAGDWDNRLRELAALTGWLARQSERPANWQVVNLKVAPEDLTDSRILYIAGIRPLEFTDEEKAKLKRYVDLGGMLVFHPDRPSAAFQRSVEKLLADLWPRLELTAVDPRTHPIGDIYVPLRAARLQQLASPTRVRALVVHGQPADAWERRQYVTAKHQFDLGAALHYFANDRAPLKRMPTKLTSFAEDFSRPLPVPTRAVTLARIRHDDNPHRWDPEPLAMERFRRRLRADHRVNCRIKVVAPDGLAAADAKVAHLTGVGAVGLDDHWDAIDAWLADGGTLIVDQAGGPREGRKDSFDAEFRKLIRDRYGEGALSFLGTAHPWLNGLGNVGHRNVMGLRRTAVRPRLEAVRLKGRVAVVYSRYDLTCGLLGNPNPLVAGADGEGAQEIFSRLVLGAAGVAPAGRKGP